MRLWLSVSVFFLLCVEQVWAHSECARKLVDITIQTSGRDHERMEFFKDASAEVYHRVGPMLGYKSNNMLIQSLTPNELVGLIGGMGYPPRFWLEGYQILSSAKQGTNVLEFIEAGRSHDKQFINDTTGDAATILVLAHVAGHYDVNEHYFPSMIRDPDRIADSYELAKIFGKLLEEHDFSEVTQFYQLLQTLSTLQDWSRGTFEDPDHFDSQVVDKRTRYSDRSNDSGKPLVRDRHGPHSLPRSPTRSVMQALVNNLPPTAAPWKTDLLRALELKSRLSPVFAHFKILNEGWATFAEYMILKHSKYNTIANAIDFGIINAGVAAHPDLNNPYYVGVQSWLILYERFKQRPEIKELSVLEQDKAFLAYGRQLMQSGLTDFQLIRMAFNKEWVERNKVLLYRQQTEEEVGPTGEKKNLAITRDPKRVAEYIAEKVANPDNKRPRIALTNFNDAGVFRLEHQEYLDVPLAPQSITPTLFALAQIVDRPVSVDTFSTELWKIAHANLPVRGVFDPAVRQKVEDFYRRKLYPEMDSPEELLTKTPLRVTVSPDGKVEVDFNSDREPTDLDRNLLAVFQKSLDEYRTDQEISYPHERFRPMSDRNFSAILRANGIAGHLQENDTIQAASAAGAVLEFMHTTKIRSQAILVRAVQGEHPIKLTGDGKHVQINALPMIPSFELDRKSRALRARMRRATQPDKNWLEAMSQPSEFVDIRSGSHSTGAKTDSTQDLMKYLDDEDLDLISGPWLPGETWDPQQQGEGQGEEEGEPQDGQPQDGDPQEGAGSDPSDGGTQDDPHSIKVPMEIFIEMLSDQLKLKNIRETEGESKDMKTRKKGSVKKPDGEIHLVKTSQEIVRLGLAAAFEEGLDPEEVDPEDLFEMGYQRLRPEHLHVYAKEEFPKPYMKAVIGFVADRSASMDEEKRKIEKTFVKLVTELLRKIYDDVEIFYVGYGTEAKELDEESYYRDNEGGGTKAASGFELAEDIFKRYPRSQYNRYMFNLSDGDDFETPAAMEIVDRLARDLEYIGYAHIDPYGIERPSAHLSTAFKERAEKNSKRIGYAELGPDGRSYVQAILTYFGQQKQQFDY